MAAVNTFNLNRFFQRIPVSQPSRFVKFPYPTEKEGTLRVMEAVRPYFLSAYKEGRGTDRAIRWIQGFLYKVERFNHGLAHGLRQGAIAKDIFDSLLLMHHRAFHFKHPNEAALFKWAQTKSSDPLFRNKLEMASSFQRSGRQSEGGSSDIPKLYKKYEWQDTVNFRKAALESGLFSSLSEIKVFEEAILWSNKGTLDENTNEDLKYLRRILHTAHTLDLRRMISFDSQRIKKDALDQLFGGQDHIRYKKIIESLWNRSGQYLKATGDRDLVCQRGLQDPFFLQSHDPVKMVNAIDRIRVSLFDRSFVGNR